MYSFEERLRAVNLYLKFGKRCRATIRQLGYPTKNTLKAWYAEFERRGDLRAGYSRPKPKYSDEQRNVAVDHWANHGRCYSFTLKALGYPGPSQTADARRLTADRRDRLASRLLPAPGTVLSPDSRHSNSTSDNTRVSATTATLACADHCSGDFPLPGTA